MKKQNKEIANREEEMKKENEKFNKEKDESLKLIVNAKKH